MLSKEDLKQKLIDAVMGTKNADDSHNKVASTIQDYIKENIVMKGAYVGVDTTKQPPPPDPKAGSYKWKASSCVVSGSMLKASASSGSVSDWVLSIQNQIVATTTFVGPDDSGDITLSAPSLITGLSLSIDMSGVKDISDSMDRLATGIVNGITKSVPSTSAAVSTTPGLGSVTGSSFE